MSGDVCVTLLMGKSRVAPLKPKHTVPRLELTSASSAAKLWRLVTVELGLKDVESVFWTDSKATLALIHNESRQLPVFVANRCALINDTTDKNAWRYVRTTDNVADIGSLW